MRLLLIEDHCELAELLKEQMAKRGFDADLATTGAEALEMAQAAEYAAAVLDLGLPDMDGHEVLRKLKQRKTPLPTLILTARGQVQERVAGLEAGADDYVVKPFAFDELNARLNVLVRRRGQPAGEQLQLANLTFDARDRHVEVAGTAQLLSAQELNLLEILMRRSGRVVTKGFLEDQLFGLASPVSPNALEVAVHRLRKRLQVAGAELEIHAIRGVGYMLASSPHRASSQSAGV